MGKRVVIIILDGVGVGALPDAHKYQDEGSNTLGNLADSIKGLFLPTLESLGLGKVIKIKGIKNNGTALAAYGKMAEVSPGKDSISGHWEICGIILPEPFPTYPKGFPPEIINEFERGIARKIIGNYPASGTEIIEKLGPTHMKTGQPIVYTSADSVFQVAAHKDVITLRELYHMCEIARRILRGKHNVARVIARPFTGLPGSFKRTSERRDYSIKPLEPTLLDQAIAKGLEVLAIGKIDDLFGREGYTRSIHSVKNNECMKFLEESLHQFGEGIIICNLVQFDMDWGHRNDIKGFHDGLLDFDQRLDMLIKKVGADDLIFITADHGCDPTTPSTDHSREYVPLLSFGPKFQTGVNLGVRNSFADLAQTAAEYLNIGGLKHGKSFFQEIFKVN